MEYSKYAKKFNINNDDYERKMKNLFSLYYPQQNRLSNGQKQALEDILGNAKLIVKALGPLKQMGLSFSLSLVGGAVRDFALDKSETINDYDFVLNLDSVYNFEKVITKDKLVNIFNSQELSEIDGELLENLERIKKSSSENSNHVFIKDDEVKKEIYTKLVWGKLVEKQVQSNWKEYTFFKNKDVENKYLNKHINGIFQTEGINGKKIDLILSNYGGMAFATTFDFEICKAEMDLWFLVKNEHLEGSEISELLNNMWLTPGMLRDVDEKTLSIRADNFGVEHIHYFMNKHYLKLKEKFPEHKLNYFEKQGLEKKDVLAVLHHYKLQHELPQTEKLKGKFVLKV